LFITYGVNLTAALPILQYLSAGQVKRFGLAIEKSKFCAQPNTCGFCSDDD